MKTIILPTDFSANSEAALRFAARLACQQGSKLVVLHVYQMPITAGPLPFELPETRRADIEREAMARLQHYDDILFDDCINSEVVLREGDVIDQIVSLADERAADLIVMGTKGATGLADIILGTITTGVVQKANTPVMAIPEGTVAEDDFCTITYATDFLPSDIAAIKVASEIAQPLNAKLKVLHVATAEESDASVHNFVEFIDMVKNEVPYEHLSFELLHGPDVVAKLLDIITGKKTDLLIVSSRFRNLFGRIFTRSISSELVQSSSIPVVVFHHSKSEVKVA